MKILLPKIIVLLLQENFIEFYGDDKLLVREFCKALCRKPEELKRKLKLEAIMYNTLSGTWLLNSIR